MVCRDDWETRHPQDFVRGEADIQTVPWVRDEVLDSFMPFHWTPLYAENVTITGGGQVSYLYDTLSYISDTTFYFASSGQQLSELTIVSQFNKSLNDTVLSTENLKFNTRKALAESSAIVDSLRSTGRLTLTESMSVSSAGSAYLLNYIDPTYFASSYVGQATTFS